MCVILFNLCALPSARLPARLVCRPMTFNQPQRTRDGLLPGNAEERGKGKRRRRHERKGERERKQKRREKDEKACEMERKEKEPTGQEIRQAKRRRKERR